MADTLVDEAVDDDVEKSEMQNDGRNGSQIDYRFFIGIKLVTRDEELTAKRVKELVRDAVIDFVKSVNHELAGDFYSVSNSEMSRYARMEKQLMKRISRRCYR